MFALQSWITNIVVFDLLAQSNDFILVKDGQSVVEECVRVLPFVNDVLQVRQGQAAMIFKKKVVHFGTWKFFHLRQVVNEYLQSFLRMRVDDPRREIENQINVFRPYFFGLLKLFSKCVKSNFEKLDGK